ncbi:unnamed protein product [Victoria cruziana]
MADDLQGGVCSGNWWARSGGGFGSTSSSSLCGATAGMPEIGNGFGWSSDIMEMKTRSGEESVDNRSNSLSSGGSMVFQEAHRQDSGGVLMDSSLQLAGFGVSPSMAPDWGHALMRGGGRADGGVHTMLQEEGLDSLPIFRREQSMNSGHFHKDWACGADSNINAMKPMQQNGFFGLEQRLNSTDSSISGRGSVSLNNLSSYGCPSAMLQGLLDQEAHLMNVPAMNCRLNAQSLLADEFSPPWTKFPQFLKPASSSTSSSPPKHQPSSQLQFQNNASFWSATAAMAADIRPTLYASSTPQFLSPAFEDRPSIHDIISKRNSEEIRDVSSPDMKKSSSTESFKRPRIETPTPLPTFKVRKEKLSDRVTALQQLVSPFGKTDTASVLQEAIQYIKFLHEQVNVLSNPYMKSGVQMHRHPQNSEKSKDHEGPKQDLKSRGLCLVPVSSTFPSEAASDFWTPTFGVNYR